jgi:hypothetical protein
MDLTCPPLAGLTAATANRRSILLGGSPFAAAGSTPTFSKFQQRGRKLTSGDRGEHHSKFPYGPQTILGTLASSGHPGI